MGEETVSVHVFGQEPREWSGDLLAYLVEEDIPHLPESAGVALNRALHQGWSTGDFKGKKEQTLLLYPGLQAGDGDPPVRARRVLFAGLGKQDDSIHVRREQLRLAGGTIARQAGAVKAREVMVVLPKDFLLDAAEIAECLTEGVLLGNYHFEQYKTPKKDDEQPGRVERLLLHDGGLAAGAVLRGLERGRALAEAVCAARDMANRPGNGWTPTDFAEYGKRIAKQFGLKCKVLDKSAMEKLGMGGILGVNQGSAQPPKLVTLEYRDRQSKSNHPAGGQGADLRFRRHLRQVARRHGGHEVRHVRRRGGDLRHASHCREPGSPASTWWPWSRPRKICSGPAALKPGDIIRHYGGKTSEIINTDAEGRLILADALAYGIEVYKPEAVIDLATLTGAAIIGLGHHYSGLLGNNDLLAAQLLEAGARAGEPLWRLPLGPDYRKQIDSRVADIKNAGSDRSGGTITAACYLQEFVGDTPWAHLDIAGTAWDFTEKSYIPKGPSGIGVRTLVALLATWQSVKTARTAEIKP